MATRKNTTQSKKTKNKISNTLQGHEPTNPKGRKFTKKDREKAAANCNTSKIVHKLVEGTMLDYLREALTAPNPKRNGHAYYEDFIDAFLEEAVKDPNSQPARMLGSGLFSPDTLSKLDSQTNKLMQRDIDFHTFRVRQTLFDKQQVVYDNENDDMIIICSRRSGKTELNARIIVKNALIPDTPIAYLNLTFKNAIAQMFDKVLEIAGQCELQISRSSKADGYIEFANGSRIDFYGNSNNSEADKLRGFKYKIIIIDEVGAQRNLQYLINDVLDPLQKDFARHQMIFTGTPPRNKVHYSHKIWNNPAYKHYSWTLLDNPYIPNRDTLIEDVCKKLGLTADDPFIRREFLGDMGAVDTEAQVYKGYKTYKEIPADFVPTHAWVGVDFGYNDFNGVVSLIADEKKRVGYVTLEKKFNKASVKDIADSVIEIRNKVQEYVLKKNPKFNLSLLQVITDTNEKSVSYELCTTYGIKNVFTAYKYDKAEAISQLAEWLRNGTIYIPENGECAEECENTLYKRDDKDNILSEIDDNMYHPDILDALLYVSRQFAFDIMKYSSASMGTAKPI